MRGLVYLICGQLWAMLLFLAVICLLLAQETNGTAVVAPVATSRLEAIESRLHEAEELSQTTARKTEELRRRLDAARIGALGARQPG
jgi:hypothetical protein